MANTAEHDTADLKSVGADRARNITERSKIDARLVKAVFVACGKGKMSYADVGRIVGLTGERVRQLYTAEQRRRETMKSARKTAAKS